MLTSRHPDAGPSGRHRRQCCHCRSVAPYGAGKKRSSRTSPTASQEMAPFRAHASASSILAASSIQNPPMCSVVSVYGPSVTCTLPSGCFRTVFALAGRGNAAGELPHAGSNHFAVERMDLFDHRFGYGGRVEVVGKVVANQILWHDFSFFLERFSGGPVALAGDLVDTSFRSMDASAAICWRSDLAAQLVSLLCAGSALRTGWVRSLPSQRPGGFRLRSRRGRWGHA